MAQGLPADDDLSDLACPDTLAEIAASDKLAEAEAGGFTLRCAALPRRAAPLQDCAAAARSGGAALLPLGRNLGVPPRIAVRHTAVHSPPIGCCPLLHPTIRCATPHRCRGGRAGGGRGRRPAGPGPGARERRRVQPQQGRGGRWVGGCAGACVWGGGWVYVSRWVGGCMWVGGWVGGWTHGSGPGCCSADAGRPSRLAWPVKPPACRLTACGAPLLATHAAWLAGLENEQCSCSEPRPPPAPRPPRAGNASDEAPPLWDIGAACSPAPFNIMITCYTLFERDRWGGAGRQGCAGLG